MTLPPLQDYSIIKFIFIYLLRFQTDDRQVVYMSPLVCTHTCTHQRNTLPIKHKINHLIELNRNIEYSLRDGSKSQIISPHVLLKLTDNLLGVNLFFNIDKVENISNPRVMEHGMSLIYFYLTTYQDYILRYLNQIF